MSLLVQMRTYDVLMGILHALDADAADMVESLHEQGRLLYPEVKYLGDTDDSASDDGVQAPGED